MSMPEATIDEDHFSSSREDQIRAPGKVLHVQSIAKSAGMKPRAKEELWLGVLGPDLRHVLATLGACHEIGHRNILDSAHNYGGSRCGGSQLQPGNDDRTLPSDTHALECQGPTAE